LPYPGIGSEIHRDNWSAYPSQNPTTTPSQSKQNQRLHIKLLVKRFSPTQWFTLPSLTKNPPPPHGSPGDNKFFPVRCREYFQYLRMEIFSEGKPEKKTGGGN
jgi:hypothetical protein